MRFNDTLFICQRKNTFWQVLEIKSTLEWNTRERLPYLIYYLEMKSFKMRPYQWPQYITYRTKFDRIIRKSDKPNNVNFLTQLD